MLAHQFATMILSFPQQFLIRYIMLQKIQKIYNTLKSSHKLLLKKRHSMLSAKTVSQTQITLLDFRIIVSINNSKTK